MAGPVTSQGTPIPYNAYVEMYPQMTDIERSQFNHSGVVPDRLVSAYQQQQRNSQAQQTNQGRANQHIGNIPGVDYSDAALQYKSSTAPGGQSGGGGQAAGGTVYTYGPNGYGYYPASQVSPQGSSGQSSPSGGSTGGGYPSGYAGPPMQPTFYAPPTSMNQSQMMAGNAQAHNFAPGSIPAGDYIEPSAYSTIGTGMSGKGANSTQWAIDEVREFRAREAAQRQAQIAAKMPNTPAEIAAYNARLGYAPKAAGVRKVDPNHPTLQQQTRFTNGEALPSDQAMIQHILTDPNASDKAKEIARKYATNPQSLGSNPQDLTAITMAYVGEIESQAPQKQPTTAKEKAQALYDDPNTSAALKQQIERQGWLEPGKDTYNSLWRHSIEQAYTQQFPNGVPIQDASAAGTENLSPAVQAAIAAAATVPGAGGQPAAGQPAGGTPTAPGGAPVTTSAPATVNNAPLVDALGADWQQAYQQQVANNEARYEDIIAGRQKTMAEVFGELEGLGASETERINRAYDTMKDSTTQSAIKRGIFNTTVLDNLHRGVEEDRNRGIGELNDRLTRERLGYTTSLNEDLLQFMERRTDAYPDPGMLADLTKGVGAAGPVGAAPPTGTPTGTPAPTGTPTPSGTPLPQPGTAPQQQPVGQMAAQPSGQPASAASNPDDVWRQQQIERQMAMGYSQAEAERLFEIGNDPALKQKYQMASRSERNAMLNPQPAAAPVTGQPQSPQSSTGGYKPIFNQPQPAAQPQGSGGGGAMGAPAPVGRMPPTGAEEPGVDRNAYMRERSIKAAADRAAGAQPVAPTATPQTPASTQPTPPPAPVATPQPTAKPAVVPPTAAPTKPYNPMTLGAPKPKQPPHAPPPGHTWVKNASGGYALKRSGPALW